MTGNALAVRRAESTAVARQPNGDVNFGDLWHMAEKLVPTGMLPDHIKTPGAACAIILAGRELGMGPMRALRSLQLVKGKVVESADSQLARFKSDGGRAVFVKFSETEAELHLRHPNGDEHTERFTMEDARRAGLAGKDTWKAYPKPMLRSRVITAGLKSLGWEGGAGVYDPEEAASFGGPTPHEPSAGSGISGTEHQYGDEMTLEQALATPLLGGPTKWGGNGGKPLGDVPLRVLRAALTFFEDKLRKEHDDRVAVQAEALTLVLAEFERRETAEVPPRAETVVMPPPGRIEDALSANAAPGVNEDLF
jgi:hypothetical protein